MEKLKILDLFSGIGGFSLGLERTGGFETAAFCEIEPFPRKVLAKHWPSVPCYNDVRELTAERLRTDGIGPVDVITGGFPCQDLSVAGKQAGMNEGTRSGLWSEIARLVGELRPQFVIVENVANLLSGPREQRGGWFGRVLGDLAECGYDAEWENIPAAAVGAPHRRERIWIVAYPDKSRNRGKPRTMGEKSDKARQKGSEFALHIERCRETTAKEGRGNWEAEPDVGRVANGIPDRTHRIAGLGNAVVPQIPELIGYAILDAINATKTIPAKGD